MDPSSGQTNSRTEELRALLAMSEAFFDEKNYADCLRVLEQVLNLPHPSSREHRRLFSDVVHSLSRLTDLLPEAKNVARKLRNELEKQILTGDFEESIVPIWLQLNDSLNQTGRGLKVLSDMTENGKVRDFLRKEIVESNLNILLRRKEYKLLDACFSKVARSALSWEELYERERYLRTTPNTLTWDQAAYFYSVFRDKCFWAFEIAVGNSRFDDAEKVASILLDHETKAKTYQKFLRVALRATSEEQARELLARLKRLNTK